MRTTRVALALAFLGLVLGCEPDPAGPEMAAAGMAPAQTLFAPMFGLTDSNNSAVIHKDEIGCQVIDGEGYWFPGDWSLPCKIEVATNSENLNAMILVEATGVPNPTGKTVHWGPFNPGYDWAASYPELGGPPYPCYLLGTDYDLDNPLFTIHWKAWVTPEGNARLVCQYQKKWEFQWPS
ncbi:MAG: hypothetical protein ACWGSQ_14390 [Longimicrobiales bacterium]